MKLRAILAAALVGAITAPAAATPAVPRVEGPDLPALTSPVHVLNVFDPPERFDGCAGKVVATREIEVPEGDWDRIVLEFTGVPDGDPWDRLFSVAIGGVEVLRGTTPRTAFTLRRDITEYASLLPAGEEAEVSLNFGSYVGAQIGSVQLEFYADEPTAALVQPRWDRVTSVFNLRNLNGHSQRLTTQVVLPAAPPAQAWVDLTLSNHAGEEAQFGNRRFRVYVDGVEIAVAPAFPYVYAILGFGNENANTACRGKGTSSTGDLLHPLMWWTAQRALDVAGLHLGVGEIPPYRAVVAPTDLPMLAGARTIEVVQENGGSTWVTSLSLLMND